MKKITIVGLGAGDIEQLPLGVYRALVGANRIYLRTKEHPVIEELVKEGVSYQSFDDVYEKHQTFEAVYEEISETLLLAAKDESIIYAVPGHPIVAERTVQLLLERGPKRGIEIEIGGGQSFLDALFQAVIVDPIEGFQLLDATSLKRDEIQLKQHLVIGQVYDGMVASDVKLTLMEKLPYDYDTYIVTAAGTKQEVVKKIPLYELDREVGLNNLTSIYIPPVKEEELLYSEFSKLREIISILRGPDGCPWDKKQTHDSLKKYLIEECYELIEAIMEKDFDHMIEELGDVLLQVMLHAQIGEDEGYFSIEDIIKGLSEKMVRRHPHVFSTATVNDEEDVLKNWQEIKKAEKGEGTPSILMDVNYSLPNLLRASEIQSKASKVGFDWNEVEPAWNKVLEEMEEFKAEWGNKERRQQQLQEFGDILFALVNVARFMKINPEEALFATNQKFIRRFSFIEQKVNENGKDFSDYTLEELDQFWDEAKSIGM
ncbi:nucleoside triphosphate pyrophosphohydrolase [Cytobacillus sp. Hz8]|uniref:nucleoside triphosphate pyrophosphohydrolase n=1 Tax=Cytobacillus sp. Hz8 TaxID=3347168 RepID=UPI0035DE86E9